MSKKIQFNKESFKQFLKTISEISDTCILQVSEEKIDAISSSEDRSLSLWAKIEGDFDMVTRFNLPSVSKLEKMIDTINSKTIELIVNGNNLEYIGDNIKFKYFLHADGMLTSPKITVSKIESLNYDYIFEIDKLFLDGLIKQASTIKAKKLYIYTEDQVLFWSLGDRCLMNTDVFTIKGKDVDFEMDDFIINLDNIRLLSLGSVKKFDFRINKIGIGNINLKNDDVELNYVISSLIK